MHYVQMMDLNDEYMCKGLENTVYNICMWYLDNYIWTAMVFRPTHSYQWWSRRYITNLRLSRSEGWRITVAGSCWKSLLLKRAQIRIRSELVKYVWLTAHLKRKIIEMRTDLKHAENGANSGKSVQIKLKTSVERLSPQKSGMWTGKATSKLLKAKLWWVGGCLHRWVMRLIWGA